MSSTKRCLYCTTHVLYYYQLTGRKYAYHFRCHYDLLFLPVVIGVQKDYEGIVYNSYNISVDTDSLCTYDVAPTGILIAAAAAAM